MSCEVNTFYVDNTLEVRLSGLKSTLTGSTYLNDATVTATLYTDQNGSSAVSSGSATLTYVTSSDGVYEGRINPSGVTLENTALWLKIVATNGSDINVSQWAKLPVKRRTV